MIPSVVASERGRAQTVAVATRRRGSRTTIWYDECEVKLLERTTIAGDSPVREASRDLV